MFIHDAQRKLSPWYLTSVIGSKMYFLGSSTEFAKYTAVLSPSVDGGFNSFPTQGRRRCSRQFEDRHLLLRKRYCRFPHHRLETGVFSHSSTYQGNRCPSGNLHSGKLFSGFCYCHFELVEYSDPLRGETLFRMGFWMISTDQHSLVRITFFWNISEYGFFFEIECRSAKFFVIYHPHLSRYNPNQIISYQTLISATQASYLNLNPTQQYSSWAWPCPLEVMGPPLNAGRERSNPPL